MKGPKDKNLNKPKIFQQVTGKPTATAQKLVVSQHKNYCIQAKDFNLI